MRTAHLVSIGSEAVCGLNPDYEDGFVLLPLSSIYNLTCAQDLRLY